MPISVEFADLRSDRSIALALTEEDVLRLCTDLKVPEDKTLTLTLAFISTKQTHVMDVSDDMSTWIFSVGILPGVKDLTLTAQTRLSVELAKTIVMMRHALTGESTPPTSAEEAKELYSKVREEAYALDYVVF